MNNDFNDIIKIIKTLEDSGVLIDGVTETVKHEKKRRISCSFANTFSYFISAKTRGEEEEHFQELREHIWMKNFSSTPPFKQYRGY